MLEDATSAPNAAPTDSRFSATTDSASNGDPKPAISSRQSQRQSESDHQRRRRAHPLGEVEALGVVAGQLGPRAAGSVESSRASDPAQRLDVRDPRARVPAGTGIATMAVSPLPETRNDTAPRPSAIRSPARPRSPRRAPPRRPSRAAHHQLGGVRGAREGALSARMRHHRRAGGQSSAPGLAGRMPSIGTARPASTSTTASARQAGQVTAVDHRTHRVRRRPGARDGRHSRPRSIRSPSKPGPPAARSTSRSPRSPPRRSRRVPSR